MWLSASQCFSQRLMLNVVTSCLLDRSFFLLWQLCEDMVHALTHSESKLIRLLVIPALSTYQVTEKCREGCEMVHSKND